MTGGVNGFRWVVDFSVCYPLLLSFFLFFSFLPSRPCVYSAGLTRIDGESITVKRIDQAKGEPARWPSDAMLKGIYPLTPALTFY